MKVALYIPCFNSDKTIRACLEAIMLQTAPIDEILVIDDGSTDKTVEIAKKYPIKIISHAKNRGLASARNTAINAVSAEFVASVDSDCLAHPNWLKLLMKELKSGKTAGAGGSLLEKTSSIFDRWRSTHMKQSWEDGLSQPPFLFGSNTVFNRKALIESGLYNEELKNNYEDVDICQRLKSMGYGLRFQPKACVDHLKKDSLYSLLNTFWRWHLEFYRKQKYYAGENDFAYKLNDNLGLANRFLKDDFCSKRQELIYLDFLMALHHCVKDFEYYSSKGNPDLPSDPKTASWFSLLDLVFFYNFDLRKNSLRSMMPAKYKSLQNLLGLNLILGLSLKEKFNDQEFQKLVYKHLLISIYKIDDHYLLDKIINLALPHHEWSGLYDKTHPLLDQLFLKKFIFYFMEWMKDAMFGDPKVIKSIKLSAKMIEKEIYCEGKEYHEDK